jgi:hypothetical protein
MGDSEGAVFDVGVMELGNVVRPIPFVQNRYVAAERPMFGSTVPLLSPRRVGWVVGRLTKNATQTKPEVSDCAVVSAICRDTAEVVNCEPISDDPLNRLPELE